MNPDTNARFQCIAALIEKDTGKDLTKQMTYVKGEVTTSKRLLFVPQIADALSYTGALNGVVEGNRFEFKKEAYFSY